MKLHLFNETKQGPHCAQKGGPYAPIPTTTDASAVTCRRCKGEKAPSKKMEAK